MRKSSRKAQEPKISFSFLILFAYRSFGQQNKKWLLQLPSTGLMRAGPNFHRQPGAAEVDGSVDPVMFNICCIYFTHHM